MSAGQGTTPHVAERRAITTTQPTQTTPPLAAYPKDVAASAAVLGGMGAAWLFWGSSLAASPWPLVLRLASAT